MKKNQNAQCQKENKMIKLICAAMDDFEPEDLLELMYNKCCNAIQKDYLKDKMIDITALEGGIFIKNKDLNLDKSNKIMEFLSTEIFPSYNELQGNLIAY